MSKKAKGIGDSKLTKREIDLLRETGLSDAVISDNRAAKAAGRILARRSGKLEPPVLAKNDEGRGVTIGGTEDEKLEALRVLDTFAVTGSDAATLLMNLLVRLQDDKAWSGDVDPLNGALALVNELEPKDPVESMLVSQMVGTHLLAMECLRRANLGEQTFEGRDINLRHAERLMRIYSQQVDTLNKHRGKGQQKVTVEHVTVNDGGKAVVGNVEPR